MHGDAGSSDTTPYAGPGPSPRTTSTWTRAAACPTVLIGGDGVIVSLCTTILGRDPIAQISDPTSGLVLATLKVKKGALLGGVYAYLDHRDQLVLVDGNQELLRIGHRRTAIGGWELFVAERTSVAASLGGDSVVGLVPDWQGRVVLAGAQGTVVVYDARTGQQRVLRLGAGERVDNSISSSPRGVAVTTSHATYLIGTGDGIPRVRWRQAYDRGAARKPGQLSWGSGATPTFFGPRTGADYVTITDNASPQSHLLVYRADTGRQVCSVPVLTPGASGTENSPVAYDRSVYVASTYGYPYPAYPEGAGDSEPRTASFVGGMTRVDVAADESGCRVVWANDIPSAAVPRLSLKDGTLYTFTRDGWGAFRSAAVSSSTGELLSEKFVGWGLFADTLQMVGSIAPDGTQLQGTISGIVRNRP